MGHRRKSVGAFTASSVVIFTIGYAMPGLVLELKQDELMIINGAAIRFRTKSRIEINGKARFLFGKQILPAADSNTPARAIYVALQTAYVGGEEERRAALETARGLIEIFRAQTTSQMVHDTLDRMLELAETGQSYEALKLARIVIRHEDANQAPLTDNVAIDLPTKEERSYFFEKK